MTSISLLTLSAFNALEWFLFLKKFRRIVQLLSTFILALRNHLLQHRWVSWRVTSLNSLLELFVDIFPGWIVNLGSCLFFFFKVDFFFFFKSLWNLLQYCFCCFTFWLFGCEAYGILVPWLGIKPSPPVLKVQSLSHWIPREVRCHVHCWTSQGLAHSSGAGKVKETTYAACDDISVAQEMNCSTAFFKLKYHWCTILCSFLLYSKHLTTKFQPFENWGSPKDIWNGAWLRVVRVLVFSSISEFLTWNMMASANLKTPKAHEWHSLCASMAQEGSQQLEA